MKRHSSFRKNFKRTLGVIISLALLLQMVVGTAVTSFAVQTSNITAEGHAVLAQIETMTVKHDGLVVTNKTLAEIKAHIEAGDEPWATNFERLKKHESASLSYTPTPYEYPSAGLYGTDDAGHAAEQADARAAYTHALMWALTGDERYAEKSIEIMNAWSYVIKGHKGGNWYLQTAWVGSVFPLAGEIIRSTYDGWADEDIEQFKTMLSTAYLPELNNRKSYGNRGLTVFNALVAIGVFCDDRAAIYQGVYNWLDYVPAYFYIDADKSNPVAPTYCLDNDDKPTKEDYLNMHSDIYPNPEDSWLNLSNNPFNLGEDRAVATQDLNSRFYNPGTFYDGICGETGRDLGHSEMAYAAAIYTAEIMYNQGIDIYSIYKDRFVAFSETHSALRLGAPIPDDLYGGHIEGLGMSGTYEVGYNHLHNRLGIEMPRTTQYIRTAVRNFGGPVWPTKGLLGSGAGGQAGLHINWESLIAGQPLDEVAADDYAPILKDIVVKPGLSIGSVTFDTLPEGGNYYYIKGKAGEYEHPLKGDIATYQIYKCDPTVSFEAKPDEHIYVVDVDDKRNVLGFVDIPLTSDMIRQWPQGSVTLNPTDDAYARGSNKDQCTGTWNTIDLSATGGWGYLKFDISAMDSCSTALLQLTRTSLSSNDKGNNFIEIYGVEDTTWSEKTITWNNKPEISTGALVEVESYEAGKTFIYDVTSYVRSQIAKGKTTITLLFKPRDDCPTYFQFHSKEASASSNRPTLRIAPAIDEPILAPELGGFVWEQGTRDGATMTTKLIDDIGTFKYAVGAEGEYTRPATGTVATDYPNTLRANQNIYVEPGERIYIVWVDGDNKITAWSEVVAKEANIFYDEAIPFNFTATDDAYTRSNNPDQNVGTWAGMDNTAYLKFTLKDITAVKQATVYLYTHNESTWGSGNLANLEATYRVYGVDDNNWKESTITYNNAPAHRDEIISSTERTADGAPFWVALDVTEFVKEKVAQGETTVSLYVDRTANMNYTWQIRSRNDGNASQAPYIHVVPDTSSAPNSITPIEDSSVAIDGDNLSIPEGMTAGELRSQLSNRDEIVITSDGKELNDKAVLTDGVKVTMYDNSTELDQKTIVTQKAVEPEPEPIVGDVNGDRKISSVDVLSIKQHILGLCEFDQSSIIAMDINADGSVTSADLLMLEQAILGLIRL